jgi:O-antigen ligase
MKGLIFTYALTYGGAVVGVFKPFIALLIYCSFSIIRPEWMWQWAIPQGGNYSRILAFSLLAGWFFHGLGDWNFGRARPIFWSLLSYFIWVILSTLFVTDYPTSWTFLDNASKYLLPWVVGLSIIHTLAQVRLLAWVLMFSQAYVAFHLNNEWVFGSREVATQGFGGMDNNCNAIAMVAGAGLAFFLGMTTADIKLRWLSFACAGLMAHYPMFSESRGGMLALAVLGIVSLILLPKQPRHYWYFTIAVVIGMRLAGPMVWTRFGSSFESAEELDNSAQSRLALWADAWDMMQRYPIFGVGPDNFPTVAVEYGWPRGKECHSLWLQTGAELGIIGMALLLAFYLITIRSLWNYMRLRSNVDPWITCMARAVIASLIGFAVASQFVSLEGLEFPYYVVLVGAAVLKLAPTDKVTLNDSRAPT